MAKTLKLWNGRQSEFSLKRGSSIYIAAFTQKQASELLKKAFGLPEDCTRYNGAEIRNYFNESCWGNSMDHITPTEPCVYGTLLNETTPSRLI